jgi:aspartate/methionine/tyrosine aminotransferase
MDGGRTAPRVGAPEGGVVALPRIARTSGPDPEALYRALAEGHQVFVVPGRCFEMDNGFFRLGFGAPAGGLAVGLERIRAALAEVGRPLEQA